MFSPLDPPKGTKVVWQGRVGDPTGVVNPELVLRLTCTLRIGSVALTQTRARHTVPQQVDGEKCGLKRTDLEGPSSATVSVFGQRGVSPLQVCTLRPVTESNCVLVRGGGKQLEVNE